MQQTDKYQLNLVEPSDKFLPEPLNENAQKLETALATETETRQAETAALDTRVAALEVQKIFFGEVAAEGHDVTIDLGVTPKAVLFFDRCLGGASVLIERDCHLYVNRDPTYSLMNIVENGFFVRYVSNGAFFYSGRFNYIAFA